MTKNETERLSVVETKLDYIQDDIAEIKKLLSTDYAQTKKDVEQLKEVTAPLTNFRKKLWQAIVFTAFTSAFLAIVFVEIQRYSKGA